MQKGQLTGRTARFVRRHRQFREPMRYVLTRVSAHRQGPRQDIAIFSARRSGSTWLMEVIATQPRMRYVNEAFLFGYLPGYMNGVLRPDALKVVEVPAGAEEQFRRYLTDPRASRIRTAYNPLSPTYHPFTDRRVLKIVHATAIANWIDDQGLGFHIVYLLRHPVATVMSMAAVSSAFRSHANLASAAFSSKVLTPTQRTLARALAEEGDAIDRYTLEWCLDNAVPFRCVGEARRRWTLMTYEEMCLAPRQSIDMLARNLDLPRPDLMLGHMEIPSAATAPRRVAQLVGEIGVSRVTGWQYRLGFLGGKAREERILSICNDFGIDAYRAGSAVAGPAWLNFPEITHITSVPRDQPNSMDPG